MPKSFSEFLALLDDEGWVMRQRCTINDLQMPLQLPMTAESANAFATACIAASTRVALQMLEEYHRWLHNE